MKIYDAFMFCHELDLLEVRLKVLYPVVDYFIIQESTYTHSGRNKPLYFLENMDRFAWAKEKIIHHILCGDQPKKTDDFALENNQRKRLYELAKTKGQPDDILLISDVDEIPSREVLARLDSLKLPIIFEQDLYYYNIKTPLNKKWLGTQAMRFKDETVDLMRKDRATRTGITGGWHFSYFMTPDEMVEKLNSFAHSDTYGNPPFNDVERLKKHIAAHTSFLEKPHGKEPPLPIPDYVLESLPPLFLGEI